MTDKPSRFIVRVYGIVFNEAGELLLSDELRFGKYMTKFVGGGLEFGEGLLDGLRREFIEECQQEIEPGRLFHINDYYQKSAFHTHGQLLSVYYFARFLLPFSIVGAAPALPWREGDQYFRWVNLNDIQETDLTWPIDKDVIRKLKISGIRD